MSLSLTDEDKKYLRLKQYYNYLEADNTYHILLKDTDSLNYDPLIGHNFIDQYINPIGKEHIKKALCKVVFVSVPKEAIDDGNSRGIGYIQCNLAKNTIVRGNIGPGYIGGFNLEELTELVDLTIPQIITTGGILDPIDPDGELDGAGGANTGVYWDTQTNSVQGILAANAAALPNVSRPAYDLPVLQSKGVKATMFSNPYVLIDNPFGKRIKLDIKESNFQTNVDFGNAVGEELSIMLEVKLIPNFQENDRLNY